MPNPRGHLNSWLYPGVSLDDFKANARRQIYMNDSPSDCICVEKRNVTALPFGSYQYQRGSNKLCRAFPGKAIRSILTLTAATSAIYTVLNQAAVCKTLELLFMQQQVLPKATPWCITLVALS